MTNKQSILYHTTIFFSLIDYTYVSLKPPVGLDSELYFGCQQQDGVVTWIPYDNKFNSSINKLPSIRGLMLRATFDEKNLLASTRISILQNNFCSDSDYKQYLSSKCLGSKRYAIRRFMPNGSMKYANFADCQ